MEDVIEDIIGMESSFKEEGTDSPLLMQRTVSVSRPEEVNEIEINNGIRWLKKKRNLIWLVNGVFYVFETDTR